MKIKALKALVGEYGRLNKGDIIDLHPHIANQLLAYGYVEVAPDDPDSPAAADITDKREPRRRKAAK
ncbi:hypothetical protein [Ferirhizobium litorale]|uniref:Uncharacterized protein n=1 Tax=Ferirhizobium litorale TaxID=2927786 RepID=A0AAE3U365_9HYPH|nr:hypothetical protein [Fererhizobium litorale]MDI7923397.1 hypothetical protein [Fererhizobium litorale]